LIKFC